MLLLEYGLCTDQRQPTEIAAFKDDIQRDIRAQVLFSSLNPTSKENAEMCAKNLLSLESKTEIGKGVLGIFRANTLSKLGQREEAKKLFFTALTQNPANAGAWKDLGDIFYNEYEMPVAWECWEMARRLLPTHKNLLPVADPERKLLEAYPEFF